MLGCEVFDMEGRVVPGRTVEEILRQSEIIADIDYRRVGLYECGAVRVSTVLTGWCAGHSDDGRPLIFETEVKVEGEAVFRPRYTNRWDAAVGHVLLTAVVSEWFGPARLEAGC